jgi:hypothetical protein
MIFTNLLSLSFYHYRKARRKERDDAEKGDTKLYLDESVLEMLKFTPADLRFLVDMPPGLDYNEWLASFSEYPTICANKDVLDECLVGVSSE